MKLPYVAFTWYWIFFYIQKEIPYLRTWCIDLIRLATLSPTESFFSPFPWIKCSMFCFSFLLGSSLLKLLSYHSNSIKSLFLCQKENLNIFVENPEIFVANIFCTNIFAKFSFTNKFGKKLQFLLKMLCEKLYFPENYYKNQIFFSKVPTYMLKVSRIIWFYFDFEKGS